MLRIEDDLKRDLTFGTAPKRVVSLVPSDTFTVQALGCGSALVGRTDYCETAPDLPSVGGTKNPSVEKIADLAPDLVIANKEENTKSDLEALVQRGIKVYICFPHRAADGLAHLARLAKVFGVHHSPSVRELVKKGYDEIRLAEAAREARTPLRTFCPIWMKPLMTIHGATFMSDVLDLAGAQNVFADRERRYPLAADLGKAGPVPAVDRDTRYPRVPLEEVVSRAPELVLLPDEPHPFTEEDAQVFRDALPNAKVVHVKGKDLCWYGAWTVDGLPRVTELVKSLAESR